MLDIDTFMQGLREEMLGQTTTATVLDAAAQRKLADEAFAHLRLANRARESLPSKLDVLPLSAVNRALLGLWERSTRSRRRFNDGMLNVLEMLRRMLEWQGRSTEQELLELRRETLDLRQRLEAMERRGQGSA